MSTNVQTLEAKILAGESVSPEQFAAAQAADGAATRIAELTKQRQKQLEKDAYVSRRNAEFEATKRRFDDLRDGFFKELEKKRQAVAAVISEYTTAANDFNSQLSEVNEAVRSRLSDEYLEPLPSHKTGASDNGAVTIDGKSTYPVATIQDLTNTFNLAINNSIAGGFAPAFGISGDWIKEKGETRRSER